MTKHRPFALAGWIAAASIALFMWGTIGLGVPAGWLLFAVLPLVIAVSIVWTDLWLHAGERRRPPFSFATVSRLVAIVWLFWFAFVFGGVTIALWVGFEPEWFGRFTPPSFAVPLFALSAVYAAIGFAGVQVGVLYPSARRARFAWAAAAVAVPLGVFGSLFFAYWWTLDNDTVILSTPVGLPFALYLMILDRPFWRPDGEPPESPDGSRSV